MRASILLPLTLLLFAAASAAPDELWNRTYGGPYSDGAWSVASADEGYIIAGHSCSGEKSDLLLLKVDPLGEPEWQRTLGGSGEDLGLCVRAATDGGFIVAGSSDSFGIGGERLWLVKLDSLGGVEWERLCGGFVTSDGFGGWAVDEASSGGYIAAGYSPGLLGRDVYLVKVDARGEPEWERTLGGPEDDMAFSVIATSDGGFLAGGYTTAEGQDEAYLAKVGPTGETIWERSIDWMDESAALAMIEVESGYVISGRREKSPGDQDVLLMEVGPAGEVIWERSLGGSGDQAGLGLRRDGDGGYIVAGRSIANGCEDMFLLKTDEEGNLAWQGLYGGPGSEVATAIELAENGYIVAGMTDSFGSGMEDLWLLNVERVSAQGGEPMEEGMAEESEEAIEMGGAESRPPDDGESPSVQLSPVSEEAMEKMRSQTKSPTSSNGQDLKSFFRI
ncbi:MAG: hypothetical protein JW986_01905 [Methanotrichaceae archaeon]|nr:hypothetical protein [Methanotrichaceae archaeon]